MSTVVKNLYPSIHVVSMVVKSVWVEKREIVGSLVTSQLQRLQDMVKSPVVNKYMLALLVDGILLEEVADLMVLNNSPLEGYRTGWWELAHIHLCM